MVVTKSITCITYSLERLLLAFVFRLRSSSTGKWGPGSPLKTMWGSRPFLSSIFRRLFTLVIILHTVHALIPNASMVLLRFHMLPSLAIPYNKSPVNATTRR
jgi:hypothetical protein